MSTLFWKKLLIRTGIARLLPSVRKLAGGGTRYLRHYGDRLLSVPFDDLRDEALFPDVHGPDAINLALGAPRCETPPGAPRGLNDRRGLSVWGSPELRAEVAAQRKLDCGVMLDPDEEVLITHGATGAFSTALDAFVNPGSRVVLLDPTSPIFPLGLKHRRARVRWVPTTTEEGRTRFDATALAKALRGAQLLVLADPATPTGGVLAAEDLEQLAWWAKRHDALIYLDESFARFRYEGDRTHLAMLPHAEGRILCAGSVSKTYGLAGARVGWLTGDRHLVRACAAVAAVTAPFVSPVCQQIALAALRSGEARANALRDEFAGRRRYVFERLQAMGLEPTWPAGGFFFWVPVGPLNLTGRDFARQLLCATKVLVGPGEPFGPSGRDFVRLSYAAEEGRLREGLARMAEFVGGLSKAEEPLPPVPPPRGGEGGVQDSISPEALQSPPETCKP